MTNNKLLLLIVAFTVGSIMGFLAGTLTKNSESLRNISSALKELSAKKPATDKEGDKAKDSAKNKPEIAKEEVFSKIETLIKDHRLETADFYFTNLFSQNPGNWEVLHFYRKTLLDYCRQLHEEKEYDTVLEILDDMEETLQNQVAYVKMQDAPKLQQALIDVEQYHKTLVLEMTTEKRAETSESMKTLLAKSNKLLAVSPSAYKGDKLTKYWDDVKDNLKSLQSLDLAVLDATEANDVHNKIIALEKILPATNKSSTTSPSNSAQRISQLLDQAEKDTANFETAFYYLHAAQAVLQQWIGSETDLNAIKTQVKTLSQRIEKLKVALEDKPTSTTWEEVEREFSQLKLEPEIKAQEAINKLLSVRQSIMEKSTQLPANKFSERTKVLLEKVNSELAKWQNQQTQRYEKWAIVKLNDFYKEAQKSGADSAAKENLYHNMLYYLGDIDNRTLSTPVAAAYNEAFNAFYNLFNSEEKIALSSQMVLKDKRPLSDF